MGLCTTTALPFWRSASGARFSLKLLVQESGSIQTIEKSDFFKKSDFLDFWVVWKLPLSCTRKAQLFGICCEGIPRQYNYLIDEEQFPEKNANTVISLLDHFFTNYGLGEKWVHLTADNCFRCSSFSPKNLNIERTKQKQCSNPISDVLSVSWTSW